MQNIPLGNMVARRTGWIAFLTCATITAGSFVFACAILFPAFATLAALHMSLHDAFALIHLDWIANQTIGYGFLYYPQTWDSFAWGATIGTAALVATAATIGTKSPVRRAGWTTAAIGALVLGFASYEGVLYASTVIHSPYAGDFGAPVVIYVLEVNGLDFAGLLLQCIGWSSGLAVLRGAVAGTAGVT